MSARPAPGIEARHGTACPARKGGKCARRGCGFRAEVWSPRDGKRIRKAFPTIDAAKSWRADAKGAVRRGRLQAGTGATLREAPTDWLDGAKTGAIFNRSGDPYKPSALRGYETSLTKHVLPALGALKVAEVDRPRLQAFAAELTKAGWEPSTVRNILMPVRAVFGHLLALGEVAVNPTAGLRLPAPRGRREHIIGSPAEAAALIAAVPAQDRALWATALYAGLRLGELQALQWRDVDFQAGVIRVVRSWDKREGEIAPKSAAGRRRVPIPTALREALLDHAAALWKPAKDSLVFGRPDGRPFDGGSVRSRARRYWRAAGLEPVTLHEARHSYASLMIAAEANAKALSAYLGHGSITITMDRYGHLMKGNEAEAAENFDRYLAVGQNLGQSGPGPSGFQRSRSANGGRASSAKAPA